MHIGCVVVVEVYWWFCGWPGILAPRPRSFSMSPTHAEVLMMLATLSHLKCRGQPAAPSAQRSQDVYL